ncbi:hypothetical protein FSB78_02745 [Sphingomonas ginsenosidivorax]|uniref:Uncharacterized protein n=1 Tax=Sphingomonas ginsenosidivorax TaxID=862135 RepID=A0A5C6UCQ7_9SPHN|nr:hypothetical protein [Sphingomonas ginsenosidivorax]TXC69991.1 hypothetical protein FSB78_02745 [Sphingomonas ginsenosidivorax]
MTPFRFAALALFTATGAQAMPQAAAPIATVDIPASTIVPTETDLARLYQDKAQADPGGAQVWTACAAAATKRSASPTEADDFAVQMAKVLKLIVPDPSRSPCEDAISSALWAAAGGARPAAVARPAPTPIVKPVPAAEAERLRLAEEAAKADAAERARVTDFNRQAAERAKADTDKILADKQAGIRARDDYQAAQAQYQTDKARADAALAAQAEYDRQMRDYRAKYGK